MKFYNDKDEKINEINLYNTFDTFDILNDNIRYILSHENFNKIVDYKNKINNLEGTLKEIDAAIERNKSKIRKKEK